MDTKDLKGRFLLRSIAECSRAIEFLREEGDSGGSEIVLVSGNCPVAEEQRSGERLEGHRIVRLDDNYMECRVCHKRFRQKRRALTPADRIVFRALDGRRPLGQLQGELLFKY